MLLDTGQCYIMRMQDTYSIDLIVSDLVLLCYIITYVKIYLKLYEIYKSYDFWFTVFKLALEITSLLW